MSTAGRLAIILSAIYVTLGLPAALANAAAYGRSDPNARPEPLVYLPAIAACVAGAVAAVRGRPLLARRLSLAGTLVATPSVAAGGYHLTFASCFALPLHLTLRNPDGSMIYLGVNGISLALTLWVHFATRRHLSPPEPPAT